MYPSPEFGPARQSSQLFADLDSNEHDEQLPTPAMTNLVKIVKCGVSYKSWLEHANMPEPNDWAHPEVIRLYHVIICNNHVDMQFSTSKEVIGHPQRLSSC